MLSASSASILICPEGVFSFGGRGLPRGGTQGGAMKGGKKGARLRLERFEFVLRLQVGV